ncbi:MAG: ATP-dependent protease ATPase subunit HslU [Ktedonobacterales bacterium]|nr:ATP-dependent protease ATPase subunit HslU [Ktedonobacterales bacterium]
MKDLTPEAIVQELDRYIIGQPRAKRAVAVALRNRQRRMKLPEALRAEVTPKNILMIGPTGVGKTEIARRIAKLAAAPFLKVEVTKFTQVGYVGRDVDSIIRDLMETAIHMVQDEREADVQTQAELRAQERILSYLTTPKTAREIAAELGLEPANTVESSSPLVTASAGRGRRAAGASAMALSAAAPHAAPARGETARIRNQRKKRIAEALANHLLEERIIEIELDPDDPIDSMLEYVTNISTDDTGEVISGFFTPPMIGNHRRTRRVSVRDARRLITREEAQKLIDMDQVVEEASRRAEGNGIVFLDEIDKIVGTKIDMGPDVAGEGVQRDLLPIVEGSTVTTRYGPIRTDHILWIAAGAFHKHKPSDLIPELQGRFPLRVELDSLSEADFRAILSQPEHALTRQYQQLLATEDVQLIFTDDALDAMARFACQMNDRQENIGARRLHTIIENVVEDLSFDAPKMAGQTVTIDAAFVEGRLGSIMANEDLSRYIL